MIELTWMITIANVTKNTSNKFLLLPLSVVRKKMPAMIELGATHNFISNNMLDIIKFILHNSVKWWHASEPLQVSLVDNSVVLSTKVVVLMV